MPRKLTDSEILISYHRARDLSRELNYKTKNKTKRKTVTEADLRHLINNERKVASRKVYKALKRGILIKPTICPVCLLERRIIAQHPEGCDKPLCVSWICVVCAGIARRKGPTEYFRGSKNWERYGKEKYATGKYNYRKRKKEKENDP